MAKDPAILWYWNDWNGGTSTFNRHLKGCYIDLLSAQFNSGRLSLSEIKTVLGADFGPTWPTLQKKFRKDENDLYYNERMEEEKIKRRNFTEGRRKNLKGNKPLVVDHMGNSMGSHVENEIEDENTNVFKDRGPGEGKVQLEPGGFLSIDLDKTMALKEIEIGATIEYLRLSCKKVLDNREVVDQWEAFKIKQFAVKEWYSSHERLLNHFRDSLKLQITNGTYQSGSGEHKTKSSGGKSAGANQLVDLLQSEIRSAGS